MYSRSPPGARSRHSGTRPSTFAAVHVHKELGGAARRACGPDCPGSGEGLRSPGVGWSLAVDGCELESAPMAPSPIGATWSACGEGERLWFIGTLATIRIPGEAVEGRYALIGFLFPKYASPPRHTHLQDESYIVLDGQLAVHACEQRFELNAGGAATVPMGLPHTFRVDTETAHVLVLSTPAGLERLVRDGGTPATAPTLPPPDAPRPSADELARSMAARRRNLACRPPAQPLSNGAHESLPHDGASSACRPQAAARTRPSPIPANTATNGRGDHPWPSPPLDRRRES